MGGRSGKLFCFHRRLGGQVRFLRIRIDGFRLFLVITLLLIIGRRGGGGSGGERYGRIRPMLRLDLLDRLGGRE